MIVRMTTVSYQTNTKNNLYSTLEYVGTVQQQRTNHICVDAFFLFGPVSERACSQLLFENLENYYTLYRTLYVESRCI